MVRRNSALDVCRSYSAESATTTPSMKVAVRAISTTVRAAVVADIPYSLVRCSLGSSAMWQTTPVLA